MVLEKPMISDESNCLVGTIERFFGFFTRRAYLDQLRIKRVLGVRSVDGHLPLLYRFGSFVSSRNGRLFESRDWIEKCKMSVEIILTPMI